MIDFEEPSYSTLAIYMFAPANLHRRMLISKSTHVHAYKQAKLILTSHLLLSSMHQPLLLLFPLSFVQSRLVAILGFLAITACTFAVLARWHYIFFLDLVCFCHTSF